MGKIRSTIDIVMDRTKNVSMSREDKDKLRRKELSDEVRAWVQKHLDGKMTREDIRARVESAGDERALLASLLKSELASDIRLGRDNAKLIDALDRLCGVRRERVSELIGHHQAELGSRKDRELELLKLQLEKDGIRGSSIVPNLARSASWQDAEREAQEHLTRDLGTIL